MNFEAQLKDKKTPIAIDFDIRKNVLLLAFGGLAQQLGFPMFEFNKITSGLNNINKIYLRDPYSLWFHRGLPDVGENIESIATFLRQYTTHKSIKKVVVFGNSGGGYAALLFGYILQADEVHAFSPKTFIDPVKRFIQNDLPPVPIRNQIQIFWHLLFRGQRKYFDLKKLFLVSSKNKGSFHIHYSSGFKIDNSHAFRMSPIANVHLHPYQHKSHNLIKHLKQNGMLSKIIEQAILLEKLHCQVPESIKLTPDLREIKQSFLAR